MLKLSKSKYNIIIDTDLGYDPDDTIALLTALKLPNINVLTIITSDEDENFSRAQFISNLVKKYSKAKIPVFAGRSYSHSPKFSIKKEIGRNNTKLFDVNSVYALIEKSYLKDKKKVKYVCIGGLTNLCILIKSFPSVTSLIDLYFTGGAFNYRKAGQHTYNIRLDFDSTYSVFINSTLNKSLITSDITYNNKSLRFQKSEILSVIPPDLYLVKDQVKRFCDMKRVNDVLLSDVLTLLSIDSPLFVWRSNQKILFKKEGIFEFSDQYNVIANILQMPSQEVIDQAKFYIHNTLAKYSV